MLPDACMKVFGIGVGYMIALIFKKIGFESNFQLIL